MININYVFGGWSIVVMALVTIMTSSSLLLLLLSSVIVLSCTAADMVLLCLHHNRRHTTTLHFPVLLQTRLVVVPNLNDDSNPGTYVVIRRNLHRLSAGTQQIAFVLW